MNPPDANSAAQRLGSDYPTPTLRRLRVYAFDPQLSNNVATAGINVATIDLPWEPWYEDDLQPGPVNEYLEVIDVDPVSGQFYEPVDLNHPHVLARNGLDPSEGDPRFHQQMVFAVAMKTIRTFERALGRRIFWSPRWIADDANSRGGHYVPVERLRVHPHALREANAYYSREKKALLFGYFPSTAREAGANWVFTALSHDIIVHETTHAILDGLHRRYAEPTSVDSLAFHEAFSDIVALLSHFTLGEAVRDHIMREGGRLDERSLMSGLARQFGHARGGKGPLREAIDDKLDGEPDPGLLETLTEAHDRGAILVAAIFDAFLTIYQQRTADLMRIGNVAVGQKRELSPDLATRLATEATKAADHVLRMCIRALDYMPPIDVRFGEFLRAIITADRDLIPNDRYNYRLAVIEAFRRRGILPENTLSLAPDSLCWEPPEHDLPLDDKLIGAKLNPEKRLHLDWEPRRKAAHIAERNRVLVHEWMMESEGAEADTRWQMAAGVIFSESLAQANLQTVLEWPDFDGKRMRGTPKVEIHSVRVTRRIGPDGQDLRQLIVEVTQRRRGFLNPNSQTQADAASVPIPEREDFIFRGGATLVFDLQTKKLSYAIRKSIGNDARLATQRAFLDRHPEFQLISNYRSNLRARDAIREPFAFAHRGG